MKGIIIYEKYDEDGLAGYLDKSLSEQYLESADMKLCKISSDMIRPCMGCFKCWYNTPGVCVTKDITRELNQAFVKDDIVVIFTKISFGSYSSTIKNVIDRSVPISLPFLKKTEGENHHSRRYKEKAKQIVVAYGEDISEDDERIFAKIIKANSLNFDMPKADLYFCKNTKELDEVIDIVNQCCRGENSARKNNIY